MKQVIILSATVLGIISVFVIAWQLISIILLFLASLLVAATARAPIETLTERGVPRSLALLIVFGLFSALAVVLVMLIGTALMEEFELMLTDVTEVYKRLQTGWQSGQRLGPLVAARLPSPEQVALWLTQDYLATMIQTTLGVTQNFMAILSQILIALVLSVYWTADRLRFERLWLSLLPSVKRVRARTTWRALEDGVGAYARSELAQVILVGGFLTVGYWALGMRYPFLWALLVALAWLVPFVGGIVAVVPLALVEWITASPSTTIFVILYTIGVLALMELVVERYLYNYSRYQKMLVLVMMIVLVDAYGLIGLIIAPFAATACQILISQFLTAGSTNRSPASTAETMQADISVLRSSLDEVRQLINTNEQASTSKRLNSLVERAGQLISETEDLHAGLEKGGSIKA